MTSGSILALERNYKNGQIVFKLNNLQKTSTENICIYNYLIINKIHHIERKLNKIFVIYDVFTVKG